MRFKPEPLPAAFKKVFPAGSVDSVEKWRSVYRVHIPADETLIVKPLRIGSLQAFFTVKLLNANGACPVLPCRWGSENAPYYFWKGGNRYLITRAIAGREADYFDVQDLGAAIRAMRELHHYSRQLFKAKPNHWQMLRFRPREEWQHRFAEMEICRKRAIRLQDDWSKQYLKLWYYYSDLAYRAINELRFRRHLEGEVLCYHDWAHHNVLISQGSAYLIDFDYMLTDLPVHDRANLILRYLRLHSWSPAALLKILWLFDRYYPWLQGELQLLRIYLMFPYEYWMLGRQYYLEKQPWSQKYFQDQWERKVANYRWREKILELIEAF